MSEGTGVAPLQLKPDDLIRLQEFHKQRAQAARQLGAATLEYQQLLRAIEQRIMRSLQQEEQFARAVLPKYGVNIDTGEWRIDPNTGDILNLSKLTVPDGTP